MVKITPVSPAATAQAIAVAAKNAPKTTPSTATDLPTPAEDSSALIAAAALDNVAEEQPTHAAALQYTVQQTALRVAIQAYNPPSGGGADLLAHEADSHKPSNNVK